MKNVAPRFLTHFSSMGIVVLSKLKVLYIMALLFWLPCNCAYLALPTSVQKDVIFESRTKLVGGITAGNLPPQRMHKNRRPYA